MKRNIISSMVNSLRFIRNGQNCVLDKKTGSWKKQENLFNGSQITRSALLPALKKVISFIRFMNQSSKKASGFLTEKYSVYYPRKYPDGMAVVSKHTDRHTLPTLSFTKASETMIILCSCKRSEINPSERLYYFSKRTK